MMRYCVLYNIRDDTGWHLLDISLLTGAALFLAVGLLCVVIGDRNRLPPKGFRWYMLAFGLVDLAGFGWLCANWGGGPTGGGLGAIACLAWSLLFVIGGVGAFFTP